MKTVTYSMVFRQSLTEWQETKLNARVQGFLDNATTKMRQLRAREAEDVILKNLIRLIGREKVDGFNARLDGLLVNHTYPSGAQRPFFWTLFKLEKETDNKYVFTCPDPKELFGIPNMGKIIPMPRNDELKVYLLETIKAMGVEDGAFNLTRTEKQAEPAKVDGDSGSAPKALE